MTRLGNSFPGNETFAPEPVGSDWLAEFRERFSEEFPEDKPAAVEVEARQHVEQTGERPAREGRYE